MLNTMQIRINLSKQSKTVFQSRVQSFRMGKGISYLAFTWSRSHDHKTDRSYLLQNTISLFYFSLLLNATCDSRHPHRHISIKKPRYAVLMFRGIYPHNFPSKSLAEKKWDVLEQRGVSKCSGSPIFIFSDIMLNQALIYNWQEIFLLILTADIEPIL